MKNLLGLFLCFIATTTLFAQPQPTVKIANDDKVSPVPYAKSITAKDLRNHLTILASDEFEGRETGTPGQEKAARYIEEYFKFLGLPAIVDGGYQQKIAFTAESWNRFDLNINGQDYKNLVDFYAFPSANSEMEINTEEILFLGYGIDTIQYSDYADVDVKGKVLLIYAGEPTDKKDISHLTGTTELSSWSSDWRKKVRTAKQKGAKAVLIIDPNIKENIAENRRFLVSPRMTMGEGENPEENYANSVFISSTVAKELVGGKYKKFIKKRDKIKKKGKAYQIELPVNLQVTQQKSIRQLIGSNVLGFIEGSDPELKDEIVIVSAHYDHLGRRGQSIYNGADDNGSGTSTVLEVAEGFAQAKKAGNGPRRSVVTMLVSGEEKGLLGSQYYVNHPTFPLENTVADVNVDMVGRVDKEHEDNPNYIYVIGSDRLSSELHEINETANSTYTNLELDYKYNAEDDPNRYYYRSDHYNFAERGIPSIFYFNGTHADYHRTSDTVEKINFEKMEKIGQLVFHTVWELANRDKRIEVDVKND
ncbi:MAG: M28 family peptidase [Saprospiraceae bacterium]